MLDLAACVLDGLGEFHRLSRSNTLREPRLAEHAAQLFDGCGQVGNHHDARVTGGAAVEGGGHLGLFVSIEERGQVRDRGGHVADVVSLMERIDGAVEHGEAVFELAVECFEPSGFSGDHRFELHDPLLPAVVESFTVGVQRSGRIGVGERPTVPGQRVRDPERVAGGAGGGEGFVRECSGFGGLPDRRKHVGQSAESKDTAKSESVSAARAVLTSTKRSMRPEPPVVLVASSPQPAAYAPNNNITAWIADRAGITERVELLSVDHRR